MISPTQLRSARGCLRRWAFKSIAKVPYEPGPAAQFGLAGHGHAEHWLLTGTPPDNSPPGRLMAEGIPHLPRPGTAHVEIDFTGRRRIEGAPPNPIWVEGVPFVGWIDWLDQVEDLPRVGDHKFTGRPDLALTPTTLREDEQGILYPFVAGQLWPHRPRAVYSRWLYYPKTKANVFPVDDCRPLDEIVDALHVRILPLAKQLYAIRQRVGTQSIAWVGAEIPCSPDACDWTGVRCDFAHLCSKE